MILKGRVGLIKLISKCEGTHVHNRISSVYKRSKDLEVPVSGFYQKY